MNELYPVCVDIISWHARGTRYGIEVDPSGLLASGELGIQLTWMDAKVGDWAVTPRRGKPVEIQALWYNALCIMEDLASRLGDEAARKRYRHMAAIAQCSFNRLSWSEKLGCLYDVINGGPPDPSIRQYRGRYTGAPTERDGAYRQGTVGRGCWDRSSRRI